VVTDSPRLGRPHWYELLTNGGQLLEEPMQVPGGGDWIVQCLGPQGAECSLHHRTT
jgi:predicted enzyme related to lactoylglutathione lyase